MIKYKLTCKDCDTKFDSWFASSNEYEKLKKRKFLTCHSCNSLRVEKTLMAPQLINSKTKSETKLNHDDAMRLVRKEHPFSRFKSDFIQSPIAILGLLSCVLILLAAVFAPLITPQNPYDLATLDLMDSRLAPGEVGSTGKTRPRGER